MINIVFYNTLLMGGIISILILCVFLVSPSLNKRYQPGWRLDVWKVFMAFLIIPAGFILRWLIGNEQAQSSVTASIKSSVTAVTTVPYEMASFQTIAENQQASIWERLIDAGPQWIPAIWSIGACLAAFYLIGVYLHFVRGIKKHSELIENVSIDQIQAVILLKHKRKKPLPVYQCTGISSPMIVGIFKSAIFIPKREYTTEDLKIIITHEVTHYLRNDLRYKALFIATLILHWYNPLIHLMVRTAGKDMEMCCDRDAIEGKDQKFKADYSDVIMEEIINHMQVKGMLFACMGSDKKTMEERFKNIFSSKKKKGKIYFLGALAILVAISAFAYANDHNVPNFESPEYQQLLEKTIADKAAARKVRLTEHKNVPYKDVDNFDELAALVADENGDYDIYEVYALAGMEPPEQVLQSDFDLSQFDSYFNTVNNCIEPHVLGNGERAIYSSDSGEPWKLKKGDIVKLHIYADVERFGSLTDKFGRKYSNRGVLRFGYLKDEECSNIKIFEIDDERQSEFTISEDGEKEIELEIPENGAYNFYLFCPGSLDIIIKWVSIDIK
ncbi:M56 family metallopeptidase [Sinanaerobacter sp. ZZT-01]|uniref:M56 family metallopeptidase n=1 Tax=Sinanaerobacter sp. ZZT-01 TaxID=3111540 RepID=UPI002D768F1A|nr:M56 family metallopeptidase [Sinanaerobacter sp. ZZT-01]WRR94643.1 M56 family metallopeptidase [Sinanaerobacter sp. ZZT-01]